MNLKDKIKTIIKHLKCKHDYETYNYHMIQGGMSKLFYIRCKNCGKKGVKLYE